MAMASKVKSPRATARTGRWAEPGSRSEMNVTFRLPDEALEKKFVAEASAAHMVGLAGHRSVGGIRASIYNAIDVEACQALAAFMSDFAAKNG